jgi:hypothetical protein
MDAPEGYDGQGILGEGPGDSSGWDELVKKMCVFSLAAGASH